MSKSDKDNLKRWTFYSRGYYTAVPDGPHIAHPLGTYSANVTDSARFSDNLPDWRKLIARGESATTTMTGSRHQLRPREGDIRLVYADGTVDVCSGVVDQSSVVLINVAATMGPVADAKARSRLLSKYIETKSTWRGGNFLAEIRETIHAFRHPVQSFYRQTYEFAGKIRTLRKVYVRHKADYAKRLADLWLAYAFGVKPTVSDANDLAETLNSLVNRQFVDKKGIRAHGHNSTATVQVLSFNPGCPGFPGIPTIVQEFTDKSDAHVWYRGAVKCNPQNANRFLLQSFGVDVFDIVPAVWEAVPWSFFIDYFLNVQEMLDSMRYWDADFAWLNRTYRNARVVNVKPLKFPTAYGTVRIYGSGGGGYRLATYVDRRPQPDPPYPSWTFRMPGFPSLKWLNIASLSQQFRSSKPNEFLVLKKRGRPYIHRL